MLNAFRIISIIEGISYLIILSVTIGFVSRDYVFILGMGHGVLFTLYLIFSLIVSNSYKWSVLIWLAIFLAAVIPFAFVPVELFLKNVAKKGQESNSVQ
ncbi:MAG: DUF3817 domain-containing protein [Pseudomonadota bacterium]